MIILEIFKWALHSVFLPCWCGFLPENCPIHFRCLHRYQGSTSSSFPSRLPLGPSQGQGSSQNQLLGWYNQDDFYSNLWNYINIKMYWNFSFFLGALLWPGSSWLSCSLLAILSNTVPVSMDRFILFQARALDIPSLRMTLQNNLQRGILSLLEALNWVLIVRGWAGGLWEAVQM